MPIADGKTNEAAESGADTGLSISAPKDTGSDYKYAIKQDESHHFNTEGRSLRTPIEEGLEKRQGEQDGSLI